MPGFVTFIIVCLLSFSLHAQTDVPVMVVEIPAGTNLKHEFNKDSQTFDVENIDGQPRSVDFLPYPGNYGFIRNTLMDKSKGGDGDALDVLLIGESVEQGSEVRIIPVAMLQLLDNGEIDDKIIAVPAVHDMRVIHCETYDCISADYPAILEILRIWFTSYKGAGMVTFEGWENEDAARKSIRKWYVE